MLNLFQYLIAADSLGASLHPFTLCFSPSLLCPHQEAAGLGKRVMVVDRVAASLSGTVPAEQHGARVTAKPVKLLPIFTLLCSFIFIFFSWILSFSIFVPCTSYFCFFFSLSPSLSFKLVFQLPSSLMPRPVFWFCHFLVTFCRGAAVSGRHPIYETREGGGGAMVGGFAVGRWTIACVMVGWDIHTHCHRLVEGGGILTEESWHEIAEKIWLHYRLHPHEAPSSISPPPHLRCL